MGRGELVILPARPKEHDGLDVCAAPRTHMWKLYTFMDSIWGAGLWGVTRFR